MAYTRVRLIATGLMCGEISCNLETGAIFASDVYYLSGYCLEPYRRLRFSPNLDERVCYERILANLPNLPSRHQKKRHLRGSALSELNKLANELDRDDEQARVFWEWGYRDGWGVAIELTGPRFVSRTLGPFYSLDPNSKANQIINMLSDKERLFYIAACLR